MNPAEAKKRVRLYENKDGRCHYPFQPFDYCWGYATAVDNDRAAEFVKGHCPTCEFWEVDDAMFNEIRKDDFE